MKYTFVILNFNTFYDTKKCIDSINSLNDQGMDCRIVIVDNKSNDDSLEKLNQLYRYNTKVDIVPSEYNVGFAKGNNLGYSFAKFKNSPDFIIILNSDVFIEDENFLLGVSKLFETFQFDILGPRIVTLNNLDQNPVEYIHDSVSKINKTLFKNFFRRFYYNFFKTKEKFSIRKNIEKDEVEGVPLHGSCLIYSKSYINRFEYAFFPETFLYGEEDFLFYLSKLNEVKLIYSPKIVVRHAEDASSNTISKNSREKKLFVLKNSTESLKKLKKIMK